MDLEHIHEHGGSWLGGGGEHGEIVISSRVRLARNLRGFPFLGCATEEQRHEILDLSRDALNGFDASAPLMHVDIENTDELTSLLLVERHLISRELQHGDGPRAVTFGEDESVSIMVNEEDHLRIQSLQSSLSLDLSYERARAIDEHVDRALEYATSGSLGYLTACPTNVGTGMRASVMLHLPGLVHLKQVEKLFHAANQTGFTVRGFFGEGTRASGDLYQISNQVTLGKSESKILQDLAHMLSKILQYEERCRQQLQAEKHRLKLEDRSYRALATLREARILSTEEAMSHLSAVRLALVLGIYKGAAAKLPISRIQDLYVLCQPAHVQRHGGGVMDSSERDAVRARYVREALARI